MCDKFETTTIRDLTAQSRLAANGDAVLQLEGGWTISDALDALAKRRVRSAPVVEDGRVLGFFDVRDLVRGIFAQFFRDLNARAPGIGDAGGVHAGQEARGDCVERV